MTSLTDISVVGDAGIAAGDVIVLAAERAPNRARLRLPELSLITAILEDAVRCLQRVSRGVTHRQFLEAFEWFESNRCDWPFAFVNVCDVLGMDPAAVRTGLRIVTKRPGEIARSSMTRSAEARDDVAWTAAHRRDAQRRGPQRTVGPQSLGLHLWQNWQQ